jgi:hypothetical protein
VAADAAGATVSASHGLHRLTKTRQTRLDAGISLGITLWIGGCDGVPPIQRERTARVRAPAHRLEGVMAEHRVLRDQSRAYLERAKQEADPKLKQLLARHAAALAQLAEKVEQQAED